jgi:diguanylate cyclase (GGDEF)-like protein/PAS domain S-box-containing protein
MSVLVIDLENGVIVDAEVATAEQCDCDIVSLKGKHISDLAITGRETIGDPHWVSDRESQIRVSSADGEPRDFTAHAWPLTISGRAYLVLVLRDELERKRSVETLAWLNRELKAVSACNQAMIRAQDEQVLLTDICRIVCELAGYRMAWVGFAENDPAKTVRPAGQYGYEEGYLTAVNITWADTEMGRGPTGTAIRTGSVQINQRFLTNPATRPWRDAALKLGYQSSIALPFSTSVGVVGVLNIYSTKPDAFNDEEVELLKELAGDLAFGIAALRDKAERKRVEQQLRVAATAFESQEGMIVTDARSIILRVNRAFTEITGYSAADVVGRRPNVLQSGLHDKAFYAGMWREILHNGGWRGEVWSRRKSGEVYPESLCITAVKGDGGETAHYVATLTDITGRKAAEDEIMHLALHDPLTHLPNRRLLRDRLRHAQLSGSRNRREGAVLFIDLDNFKNLNDTFGHAEGDLLLQHVAQRLTGCVREGDTVARLGGDEFVVMIEDLSDNPDDAAAQIRLVGDKILTTLSQPYKLASREHHISASIGATLFGDERNDIGDLLQQADIALYQAKAEGRNMLRFFDPDLQAAVRTRAALEADLRLGLKEGQLELYFQPQVDMDNRLIGAEALVRWRHPLRGLMAPAEFISLAEETGLILPLGTWVLETACKQIVSWSKRPETSHLTVSVNLSARQFRQENFVDHVTAAVDDSGADPAKLKLELTESLFLQNIEDIIAKMTALTSSGLSFSLDDFGTGYSSLIYLKRLPLSDLKIDRSFVHDMLDDANDAVIARTIVGLGRSLGLTVIAEGVETEAQRAFLAEHGCHAYQGFLFGRPMPASDFEQLIAQT